MGIMENQNRIFPSGRTDSRDIHYQGSPWSNRNGRELYLDFAMNDRFWFDDQEIDDSDFE